LRLTTELHDELVSRSSHLPHVVAAGLAAYVLSPLHAQQQGLLCANGFRDTTRIASSSPEMWRDIALANRQNLGRVLGIFIDDLRELQHALEVGDEPAIQEYFETARKRREAWRTSAQALSPSPE
jgi:prephenate dehydrogenase